MSKSSAKHWEVDQDYLLSMLKRLLNVHSPTGYTDPIVREVCTELHHLGIPFELTRRGAIRATLRGETYSPDRAVVTHVDTLGAMVKQVKDTGRLRLVPVGHWSARFAEGARVSIYTDKTTYRGTVLPLKASGHTFNEEIDSQPVGWDFVELRIDEDVHDRESVEALGIGIGDFIAFDAAPEILPSGYINARHLDDKAGVALLLAVAHAVKKSGVTLPVECHLLFTISEEVGSGASAILHGDVSEMVSIDNGTVAAGQNSQERGVTVAMADSTGPFDYHLTRHLLNLCVQNEIIHQRDIFRYYRCDSASALEAGNDIRTALITFGVDASHGYERTHIHSLLSVAQLLMHYLRSQLVHKRQAKPLGSLKVFPRVKKVKMVVDKSAPTESQLQIPPP